MGPARTSESVTGAGAMLNWITIADGDRELFEDWYNFEHLPERVGIPGFRRARRFVVRPGDREGHTDFLTVYETDDVDVLASAGYLRALDTPTELTRRVVPRFTRFRRAACRISVAVGAGSAGRCVAVRIGRADEAHAGSVGDALRAMRAAHLVHAGSLYEPDSGVSAAKSGTSEGRATAQQQDDDATVLLLEPQPGVPTARLLGELGPLCATSAPVRELDLLFELRPPHGDPTSDRGVTG